jgi:hypothetical protein
MWTENELRAERERTHDELALLLRREAWRRTPSETLREARQLKAEIRELDRALQSR